MYQDPPRVILYVSVLKLFKSSPVSFYLFIYFFFPLSLSLPSLSFALLAISLVSSTLYLKENQVFSLPIISGSITILLCLHRNLVHRFFNLCYIRYIVRYLYIMLLINFTLTSHTYIIRAPFVHRF